MNRLAQQAASGGLPFDYAQVRARSLELIRGLSAEDCQLQSMADASPLKWHLAHTTWFFETFVLAALPRPPKVVDPSYTVLFNSYYVGIGERHLRAERGLLSRPTLEEVLSYRKQIDQQLQQVLADTPQDSALASLVTLGLQHEQQHQELMLTDLKHHFSCNPLQPAWRAAAPEQACAAGIAQASAYRAIPGGLCEIGAYDDGFSYDNEGPRHRVWLEPFLLGERNVSNGDFIAFIADGGYQRPELWLSDGWEWVSQRQAQAPLYWQQDADQHWLAFTLAGLQPLNRDCALGRCATANRSRVGACGTRRAQPCRAVRRGLAMDQQRLFAVPRLPAGRWCRGRVQRQIHDQPDGPARQFLCHPGGSQQTLLPQFLPARGAVAIQRTAPGAQSLNLRH